MSKLPRAIESDPRHAAVAEALARDVRPLWPGGSLGVAHVPLSATLAAALRGASERRQIERGLEQAEDALAIEQKGLDALRARQGGPPANRVSRVLLVADGGSERFYRTCEALLTKRADRLLGLRVAASPEALSDALLGREALTKAALVCDKDAVIAVLLGLLG